MQKTCKRFTRSAPQRRSHDGGISGLPTPAVGLSRIQLLERNDVMRRTARIATTLAAMATLASATTGVASADVQESPHCQNNNGFQEVVTTGPVKAVSNDVRVGTVEVCREGSLYFGFVLFNDPMTASEYANVYFDRYDNGSLVGTVTCNDPGGNKQVMPGQRRCWTANLNGAAARYTFRAWAEKYSSHTGDLLAWGATATVR
jgi:hypothetical protein